MESNYVLQLIFFFSYILIFFLFQTHYHADITLYWLFILINSSRAVTDYMYNETIDVMLVFPFSSPSIIRLIWMPSMNTLGEGQFE